MKMDKSFIYIEKPDQYKIKDAFIALLSVKTESKNALLESLSLVLKFPAYFGFNWDALSDCLRDLNWIEEKNVVIVHEHLPDLPHWEMKIYLDILRNAIADWKPGDEHCLQVVFGEADYSYIANMMTDSV